jgi:hypothetical protein
LRTVQDIVSNALMSLYMFRMEAEPNVSADALKLFDDIVADTTAKLTALGNLTHVTETDMSMGTGIEYPNSPGHVDSQPGVGPRAPADAHGVIPRR